MSLSSLPRLPTHQLHSLRSAVSVPFPSISHRVRLQPPQPDGSHQGDKFPSPLFLNYAQAVTSGSSAFIYLLATSYRDGTFRTRSLTSILGLSQLAASLKDTKASLTTPQILMRDKMSDSNGTIDLSYPVEKEVRITPWTKTLPALLVQVSLFQTLAGPFGFLALRHISYPTMVLGKVGPQRGLR